MEKISDPYLLLTFSTQGLKPDLGEGIFELTKERKAKEALSNHLFRHDLTHPVLG